MKTSDIQVGVLIGNELVGTATFIRREVGISVFVKFARGSREGGAAVSQVEGLDIFYLPTYNLNLVIDDVVYNRATQQLQVTFRNTEPQAVYFRGTYSLEGSDGAKQTVGDVEPIFIDGNDVKTMSYDINPLPEGEIKLDLYTIYGESKGSLEKIIDLHFCDACDRQVQIIEVKDNCDMKINEVKFNKNQHIFYVQVLNPTALTCYADAEVIDVNVAGEKKTFGSETSAVGAGETEEVKVSSDELTDADLERNKKVKVRVYYGERQNNLVKTAQGTFDLIITTLLFGMTPGDMMFYSLLLIIVILIALIVWKRSRKKMEF